MDSKNESKFRSVIRKKDFTQGGEALEQIDQKKLCVSHSWKCLSPDGFGALRNLV